MKPYYHSALSGSVSHDSCLIMLNAKKNPAMTLSHVHKRANNLHPQPCPCMQQQQHAIELMTKLDLSHLLIFSLPVFLHDLQCCLLLWNLFLFA